MALPANTISKLDDYFGQYTICTHCPACQHVFDVLPASLAKRYGWQAPLAEIAPTIPCTKCHQTGCHIEIAFEKRPRGWRRPA